LNITLVVYYAVAAIEILFCLF